MNGQKCALNGDRDRVKMHSGCFATRLPKPLLRWRCPLPRMMRFVVCTECHILSYYRVSLSYHGHLSVHVSCHRIISYLISYHIISYLKYGSRGVRRFAHRSALSEDVSLQVENTVHCTNRDTLCWRTCERRKDTPCRPCGSRGAARAQSHRRLPVHSGPGRPTPPRGSYSWRRCASWKRRVDRQRVDSESRVAGVYRPQPAPSAAPA